jgi:hypothetical protein
MHMKIKEEMVKATEQDTALIFRTLHNTARVGQFVSTYAPELRSLLMR